MRITLAPIVRGLCFSLLVWWSVFMIDIIWKINNREEVNKMEYNDRHQATFKKNLGKMENADIKGSANGVSSRINNALCWKKLNLIMPPQEFPGIKVDQPKPLLTLFTTWNTSPEKYLVHNLTLRNWISLSPFVVPVLFTNDPNVAVISTEIGWKTYFPVDQAAGDPPSLKYMFNYTMSNRDSFLYAYSNSDILFTENLVCTLYSLITSYEKFASSPTLIVGKRTDVERLTAEEGDSWNSITKTANERGRLFIDVAVDYFITSGAFPWIDIAPVVVGRIGFDNYLLYYSRKAGYTVIDATDTILAVHQVTESGIYEGHEHKDKDMNLNILHDLINETKLKKEGVSCIETYTLFNNDTVELSTREMKEKCRFI